MNVNSTHTTTQPQIQLKRIGKQAKQTDKAIPNGPDVPALRNKTPNRSLHTWNPIDTRLHRLHRRSGPRVTGQHAVGGERGGEVGDDEALVVLVGARAEGEVPSCHAGGDDDYDEY